MTRKYHTVCTFDTQDKCWYDQCGFYSKRDAQIEAAACKQDYPASHVKVITHDDSAEAMMAARDALEVPKRYRKG